ncbi:vegetative cell wall protein gp1-like [Hyaena hyaena]|uniref:vegetative cell wall protein gp1-like n=1 Tax=Hyaena hyaena TaxID=95912 RepID=UPI0019207A71|nr:vegetative cell wall protein gp1-like [Hyaena hyaena]
MPGNPAAQARCPHSGVLAAASQGVGVSKPGPTRGTLVAASQPSDPRGPRVSVRRPLWADPALETRERRASSRLLALSCSLAPRPPGVWDPGSSTPHPPPRPQASTVVPADASPAPHPRPADPRRQPPPPHPPRRPLAPTLSCQKLEGPPPPEPLGSYPPTPGSLLGPRGPGSPLPEAAPGAGPAQISIIGFLESLSDTDFESD